MNITALAATALLATAPVAVTDGAPEVNNDALTVPYSQTGVCTITEQDITCTTGTQWKRVTFNDRYTRALYKFTRKEQTMKQLTTITDVYNEIKTALGEHADNFNIEGIAHDAYIFNPTTKTFDPSPETSFWAAVEANANTTEE